MAMKANFAAATQTEIGQFNSVYTNSRYAPTGNQTVGLPFPAYKEFGGRFTDWYPSGSTNSTIRKQMNLPTNNNFFRTGFINDGVQYGNESNQAWVNQTQMLGNVGNEMLCTSNDDCRQFGFGDDVVCNSNYQNWTDAKGNQSGGYCAKTVYPELTAEGYFRKDINQGGIGRACTTNSDCGDGYSCNNQVNAFGGNNQRSTGYCAQTYQCPDGSSHYLGYPDGSGIPIPPSRDQNNKGQGYSSQDQCSQNALAQQNCVRGPNGNWFAVYPGYCPVATNLREGGNPRGATRSSSPNDIRTGFSIPPYATNNGSQWGGQRPTMAFTSWNLPSAIQDGSTEAWSYARSLNPKPPNY